MAKFTEEDKLMRRIGQRFNKGVVKYRLIDDDDSQPPIDDIPTPQARQAAMQYTPRLCSPPLREEARFRRREFLQFL